MKIKIEGEEFDYEIDADDDLFEIISQFSEVLRREGFIKSTDELDIVTTDQRYLLDKAGI